MFSQKVYHLLDEEHTITMESAVPTTTSNVYNYVYKYYGIDKAVLEELERQVESFLLFFDATVTREYQEALTGAKFFKSFTKDAFLGICLRSRQAK